MLLKVYTPQGPLKDFVDSIIYMNGYGNGVAFQRMYQTIIINLGTNFGVSDLYVAKSKTDELNETVWINGKQEIPFMLENKGSTEMYVVGIKPGMLPYFADLPAIETNESTLGAAHWTSTEIYNLREQLLECAGIQAGFRLIEKYFTNLLLSKDFTTLKKIKWLAHAINTNTVSEICQSLGSTRKQLRSEAQYFFGGSIKNIQGIIRFNNTLAEIAKNSHRSLSSLHNYYDQAHFINDFKARAGITPLQYKKLCQQYPVIKHTPNFLPLQKETFLQFISAPGI
jgi:AraC-like DNA-binding protein